MKRAGLIGLFALILMSCADKSAQMNLPIAHSNNAVAIAESANGPTLYSFNGLRAGKSHEDVSQQAFACVIKTATCEQITDVPVSEGRLASSAVTLNNIIYLFGGYSVAEDGSEISTPEVFAYDPRKLIYIRVADMPLPVDDAVLFTYQNRYIYLVSGWHDTGNVSDVQVFDTQSNSWANATDYPGAPVFGHSGGAVGQNIIIADGVAVTGVVEGKRQFGEVDEVWHGAISSDNHLDITWTKRPAHPYGSLYRMAAAGNDARNQILFAGGGDNPYNIDGVGYDGTPAEPSDRVFAYDLDSDDWVEIGTLNTASMDHRGLLEHRNRLYIVGGLDIGLNVRDAVTVFDLKD